MPRKTVNVYPSGTTLGKRSTNQRRDDQNLQMATLGTLLPFPEDSALAKDKISVIRLTGAYLKFQKFLQDARILPPERSLAALTDSDRDSNPSLVKSSSSVNSLSSSVKSTNSQIFSSLMSKALDGFLMTLDHMGTVLFVSDDSGDYIGLTPPQVIGHTIYEVCDVDSQATVKKNLKLNHGDLIEENQIWRQFCIRMRSSVSAARTQLSSFYRFNMVHVSGFLKVAFGGIGGPNRNNLSCDVVSASNIDRYQVIGLVAECHLIESPVIMELTVERSTFTAMTSMDMKFTSVDTRVKQIVGFEAEDLVGQEVMNFFHPKELNGYEHTKCRKTLMSQGRAISPVYRFLTKCGEWIWMQMVVTLVYIPGTKTPYAHTMTFRVINKDSGDKGGYKLIEHKEKFVMESNSRLPDELKQHFPQPAGEMNKRPNKGHIVNGLQNTPLSDDAREAFFQARNIGLETFATGLQPAVSEEGAQPLQIIPNYTENATLEDIFIPSTMNNGKTIPHGPELYMPPVTNNINTTRPSLVPTTEQQPVAQSLSRVSSLSAGSAVSVSSEVTEHNHQNQLQASYSPSSGYQSSPNARSTSPESNLLELLSPEQLLEDNLDFEELIDTLSSPPQSENAPLKNPLNQSNTFDGIIDNLLMENLLNNEAFPDLPVYDQSFYLNHNGN